ncbi:MAG: stage III sporulation protein AF, partial [Lachnospiraceae bacterium]|nr:stage III sporulation protein AF [Lachnospiraceae bacterium]
MNGGGRMLDTIREIGIFMIAAQAVVHFAPGRQYEKYIKSVSGIIILLLFLKPVFQLAGTAWEEPQILLEKWEACSDMTAFSGKMQTDGV